MAARTARRARHALPALLAVSHLSFLFLFSFFSRFRLSSSHPGALWLRRCYSSSSAVPTGRPDKLKILPSLWKVVVGPAFYTCPDSASNTNTQAWISSSCREQKPANREPACTFPGNGLTQLNIRWPKMLSVDVAVYIFTVKEPWWCAIEI